MKGFGIIIIIVLVGLGLLLMASGFLVVKNRTSKSNTQKQSSTQLSQKESAPQPNPSLKATKTTKEYKATAYHFAYPATWSVTKNATTDGHTTLIIKDPVNAQATMLIQETAGKTYETMINGLTYMGYAEASVSIDKTSVKKFTHSRAADLQSQFEIIYVLTRNDKTYLCKLSYTAATRNSSLEKEYTALIESMNFL